AVCELGSWPVCGVAYNLNLNALDNLAEELQGYDKVGITIVRRALEQPLRTLCDNAGIEGSLVVEQVKKETKTRGFDVDKEEYVDMFEAGIIEPTKAARAALQHATSVASQL